MAGVIRYLGAVPGLNAERVITGKQFKAAGVDGQKTVRWNKANNFEVSQDDLNADALELLRQDDGLAFIDDNAKGKAANPDYVGPAIVGYPGGRAPDSTAGSVGGPGSPTGSTGGTPGVGPGR